MEDVKCSYFAKVNKDVKKRDGTNKRWNPRRESIKFIGSCVVSEAPGGMSRAPNTSGALHLRLPAVSTGPFFLPGPTHSLQLSSASFLAPFKCVGSALQPRVHSFTSMHHCRRASRGYLDLAMYCLTSKFFLWNKGRRLWLHSSCILHVHKTCIIQEVGWSIWLICATALNRGWFIWESKSQRTNFLSSFAQTWCYRALFSKKKYIRLCLWACER